MVDVNIFHISYSYKYIFISFLNTIKDKCELESFTLLLENGIHPNCLYYGYHERVSKKGENQSILRKAINENKAGEL